MEQFLENIKDLEVTTVERAQEALDKKETATFFIGRKTCPYCRKFAGTLAGVLAETKAHIYFINSEEPSQLDALQDFRSRYEMQYLVKCHKLESLLLLLNLPEPTD